MHAFWLVFTYDLLEDRRMDDDSARFKCDSCVILWTNHNSLLSIATNQIASFCIDNRLRQSTIFVSVKVAKFEIERLFSVHFNSLLCKANGFHVAVRLFSNRSQRTSKCGKNITHSAAPRVPLFCSYHILTSSVIDYWTDARQHGIYLLSKKGENSAPDVTF